MSLGVYLVAVCCSEVHKELLSRVHPGAAIGVPRTTEKLKQSLAIYCLLLIILQLCPWFCSTPLLSRRKKKQHFLLFWLWWLQGHTVRVTRKGMVFPDYILDNQRFVFSSLWKTPRAHKKKKKEEGKETFPFIFYSFSSHKHSETRLY